MRLNPFLLSSFAGLSTKTTKTLSSDFLVSVGKGGHTSQLPIAVPKYDRKKISPGFLHIGVGNFFRAHLASYLDELFDQQQDEETMPWGIVGASIFSPNGVRKREALGKQDYLQTVIERDADTVTARISGSMIDYVQVESDSDPLSLEAYRGSSS